MTRVIARSSDSAPGLVSPSSGTPENVTPRLGESLVVRQTPAPSAAPFRSSPALFRSLAARLWEQRRFASHLARNPRSPIYLGWVARIRIRSRPRSLRSCRRCSEVGLAGTALDLRTQPVLCSFIRLYLSTISYMCIFTQFYTFMSSYSSTRLYLS